MAEKFKFNPEAYIRRLRREKERPELKERFQFYEKTIAGALTFDTENEAVTFAVGKTKNGERWTVWAAPKELGGKWKVIPEEGMGLESADQLGWCMIYDAALLLVKTRKEIDTIEEV